VDWAAEDIPSKHFNDRLDRSGSIGDRPVDLVDSGVEDLAAAVDSEVDSEAASEEGLMGLLLVVGSVIEVREVESASIAVGMLRQMLRLDLVEVGSEDQIVEDMAEAGSEDLMIAVGTAEVIETVAIVVAGRVQETVGMNAPTVTTTAEEAVIGMVAEAPGILEEEAIGRGIVEGMEEIEIGMQIVIAAVTATATVMTAMVVGVVTILGSALTMEIRATVESLVVVVTRIFLSPNGPTFAVNHYHLSPLLSFEDQFANNSSRIR
jgi:hypothetical protein